MSDRPEGAEQQADASSGEEQNKPWPIALKREQNAEVAGEATGKIQEAPHKTQAPAPAPRRFGLMWNWFRSKAKEASLADWAMVFFTFIIAVSTIAYTVYARRQWQVMWRQTDEFQKQTKLMRQQLVGTQAAVLDLGISFNDGDGELDIQVTNNGHVSATDIRLRVEASEQRLRDTALIGDVLRFGPPVPVIPPGRGFAQTWMVPWHVAEHERQQGGSWPSDWPGTRTFVFRSEVTYQDGFGSETKQEMCREWLPGFTIVNKGRSSAGGGLYECGSIQSFIVSILGQEKEAEQDAKKPN